MSDRVDRTVKDAAAVSPFFRWMLFLAVGSFIAHQVIFLGLYKPMKIPGVDYGKHWEAAVALLEGRSTYLGGDLWMGFNYPQATAFTFVWLGFFSRAVAEKIWKLFLFACLFSCWWMAWRTLRPKTVSGDGLGTFDRDLRGAFRSRWWLTTAFITAAFMPAVSAIYIGNIDPYNALLAMGMVAALATGRQRLAGVIWALLTLVKLLPGVLMIPVLLWRKSRVLAAFIGTMAVYLILLLVTGRFHYEWFFFREMLPKVPGYWRWISITPIRAIIEMSGHGEAWNNPYVFEIAARGQLAMFAAAYIGILYWLRRRGLEWMRGLEVAIVLYPMLTPLLEYHHFVFMMPAIYLQTRRWAEGRMGWSIAGGLFAGWVMQQIGFIVGFQFSNIPFSQYFSTLAYFVIIGFTLAEAFRETRAAATGEVDAVA
ncbi:DUF2029 domain-containing protein [bacterium]|nr:DUF2029 domain-containing protein [bacterium]